MVKGGRKVRRGGPRFPVALRCPKRRVHDKMQSPLFSTFISNCLSLNRSRTATSMCCSSATWKRETVTDHKVSALSPSAPPTVPPPLHVPVHPCGSFEPTSHQSSSSASPPESFPPMRSSAPCRAPCPQAGHASRTALRLFAKSRRRSSPSALYRDPRGRDVPLCCR